MMVLRTSTFAEDEQGNRVFMAAGDSISEISDAGPEWTVEDIHTQTPEAVKGWNVTVRFTPSHKQWTELVTIDAVKLLKALEGE